MTKKDRKETCNKSVVVKGTIPENQEKIIKELIGIIGTNTQDVVGKIITLWLYNEGYLNQDKSKKRNKNEK